MAQLITIWWRDIPMQVIAREGRRTVKRVLDRRFQFAVDKAAMNAGRKAFDAYIEEMRRVERTCGPDLEQEADAELQRLEAEFTKERLHALIASGGTEPGGTGSGGGESAATAPASPDGGPA